jgi:hypothetical protein
MVSGNVLTRVFGRMSSLPLYGRRGAMCPQPQSSRPHFETLVAVIYYS